jgi:DNA-binding response OmpR family regulator
MEILIADTNSEVIENVRMVFNQYQPDWQLSVTEAGEQCLDIVENGICYDIVIVGMKLSDMSGFELIEHIRDDSDIPIMVISDDNDIQILVNAFDAGANDFVAVPFNKAIFIARIKALVRRRNWDIQAIERKLANVKVK